MAWFLMVQIEVSARISDYVRPERRNVWGLWVSLGLDGYPLVAARVFCSDAATCAARRRASAGVLLQAIAWGDGRPWHRQVSTFPIRIRFDRDVTIVGYCRIIAGGWEFQPSHILLEDL